MDNILSTLLAILPLFIPALVGLILASLFLSRARKPAVLVIIASILLLAQSGFFAFANLVMIEWASDGIIQWDTYSLIFSVVNLVLSLASFGFLLGAAFTDRTAKTRPTTDHQSPPHRGVLVLVLGLFGLLLFAPLGTLAWVLAIGDLRAMKQGNMDPEGQGMTTAGMILGILATVFMVVAIALFFLFAYALGQANFS